jgi:hypothetical protein
LTRYALIAALVAALGLSGALIWTMRTNAALEAENASLSRSKAALEASRDQAKEARRVEAARAERARRDAERADATIEQILTSDFGECADEEIDPDLGELINGRLLPAD